MRKPADEGFPPAGCGAAPQEDAGEHVGGADTGDRGVTGRPRDPGGREGGFGASLFCPWGSDRPAEGSVSSLHTVSAGGGRGRGNVPHRRCRIRAPAHARRGRAAAGHPTRMSPRLGLRVVEGGAAGGCRRGRGRCVASRLSPLPPPQPQSGLERPAKPAPPLSSPSPVAYPSDAVPRPSLPPSPRALSSDGRERQHAGALTQAAVSSEDLKSAARAHWRPGPGTGGRVSCPPAAPAPRPAPSPPLIGAEAAAAPPPSPAPRRRRACLFAAVAAAAGRDAELSARARLRARLAAAAALPRVPGRAAPGPAPLRWPPPPARVERRRGRRAA